MWTFLSSAVLKGTCARCSVALAALYLLLFLNVLAEGRATAASLGGTAPQDRAGQPARGRDGRARADVGLTVSSIPRVASVFSALWSWQTTSGSGVVPTQRRGGEGRTAGSLHLLCNTWPSKLVPPHLCDCRTNDVSIFLLLALMG